MNKTKIDWATMSWNPVTGCRHGCPYCYARRTATRFNAGLEDPAPLAGGLHVLPEKIKATPYPYGFEPTLHRYRLGQPQNTHCQSHAGQEIEPLRYHADQGGHHGDHGLLGAQFQEIILLNEERHPHGDQQDTDKADQLVQGLHHLGLAYLYILLCLQGQPGGIGLSPYLGKLRPAPPRHHKGA